jgi:hypothetical protein
MSQQNPNQDLSFIAAEDLSADAAATTSQRFRALRLDSVAKQVEKPTAASDVVIGVQQNLPASGKFVDVAVSGTTKARAAAAIAYGARVKIDAAGKFVTGGAGADRNWGIALEAAGADGDIFEMLLTGLVVT